ncbi:MAG: hypothetical protein WAO00_10975 [Chthoniobacterales bacterium]
MKSIKTLPAVVSAIAAGAGFKAAMVLSIAYQRAHGFWPPVVGALLATVVAMLCFWLAWIIAQRFL